MGVGSGVWKATIWTGSVASSSLVTVRAVATASTENSAKMLALVAARRTLVQLPAWKSSQTQYPKPAHSGSGAARDA